MYLPRAFAETDLQALNWLARRDRFITLVTVHDGEPTVSQLRGIIGFRFVAEQITLKFKLSQNHPLANRESVTRHLFASEREGGREIATLMRERINQSNGD